MAVLATATLRPCDPSTLWALHIFLAGPQDRRLEEKAAHFRAGFAEVSRAAAPLADGNEIPSNGSERKIFISGAHKWSEAARR